MARAFPLETVLRLRQHKEEAAERALMALETQRQQLELTMGRVHREMRQWTAERTREVGRAATGAAQQGSYARLYALRDAQTQLEEQLRVVEERRLQQQAAYLTARSAREMLSELKQQQRETHEAAMERQEQRRLEDLYLGRFAGRSLRPMV